MRTAVVWGACAAALVWSGGASGQDAGGTDQDVAAMGGEAEAGLLERARLLGDVGGGRDALEARGLTFDLSLTHVFQGNAAGGTDPGITSMGRLDLGLELDTGLAGLWDGGYFVVRTQGRYGTDQNGRTGSLSPVNYLAQFPEPGEDAYLISELHFEQAVTEWLSLSAGRFSLRDSNVFAHDETTQFLNSAFNYNLVTDTTVPYVSLGGAVYVTPTDWLTVSTYVLDTEGNAEQSGFDTVFERATTLLQEFEFTVRPGGLTGHQRLGWSWSDVESVRFSQNPNDLEEAIVEGDPALLSSASSDWSVYYDFDQFLVQLDEDRGFGVFGRLGLGDSDVNAIAVFASVGVGGTGLAEGRPGDSFGVGVYYAGLSDELPRVVRDRTRDELGWEAYYALAITPWATVTGDIQVIRPAVRGADTVVALGVRLKVVF